MNLLRSFRALGSGTVGPAATRPPGYPVERTGAGHCRAPTLFPKPAPGASGCAVAGGCLFDLSVDESERVDLYNDARFAGIVAQLSTRLHEAAATGPPWAWPAKMLEPTVYKQLQAEMCSFENATNGYVEPVRTNFPPPEPPGPPIPPPPSPVWKPCIKNLSKFCPYPHPCDQVACKACGIKHCNRTITIDKYCARCTVKTASLETSSG